MKTYIVAANTNWDETLDPCCITNSVRDAKTYAKESFFLGEEVVIYEAHISHHKPVMGKWKRVR